MSVHVQKGCFDECEAQREAHEDGGKPAHSTYAYITKGGCDLAIFDCLGPLSCAERANSQANRCILKDVRIYVEKSSPIQE